MLYPIELLARKLSKFIEFMSIYNNKRFYRYFYFLTFSCYCFIAPERFFIYMTIMVCVFNKVSL